MVENFNNIFLLILYIILIGLFSFYLIRIVFSPGGLVKEFNVDNSGVYLARIIGTFAFGLVFIGVYIFFRPNGPEGTWIYFNFIFIISIAQFLYELLFYFKVIDKDVRAKNSIFDILISIFFVSASAMLIWGLSDKIYL